MDWESALAEWLIERTACTHVTAESLNAAFMPNLHHQTRPDESRRGGRCESSIKRHFKASETDKLLH